MFQKIMLLLLMTIFVVFGANSANAQQVPGSIFKYKCKKFNEENHGFLCHLDKGRISTLHITVNEDLTDKAEHKLNLLEFWYMRAGGKNAYFVFKNKSPSTVKSCGRAKRGFGWICNDIQKLSDFCAEKNRQFCD